MERKNQSICLTFYYCERPSLQPNPTIGLGLLSYSSLYKPREQLLKLGLRFCSQK